MFQLNDDYKRTIVDRATGQQQHVPKVPELQTASTEVPYQATIDHLKEMQWE